MVNNFHHHTTKRNTHPHARFAPRRDDSRHLPFKTLHRETFPRRVHPRLRARSTHERALRRRRSPRTTHTRDVARGSGLSASSARPATVEPRRRLGSGDKRTAHRFSCREGIRPTRRTERSFRRAFSFSRAKKKRNDEKDRIRDMTTRRRVVRHDVFSFRFVSHTNTRSSSVPDAEPRVERRRVGTPSLRLRVRAASF